jgi:serine/threonine protein kinase
LGTDTDEGVVIATGALLGERYRLERRLGSGGMAAVWLAVDERLDREVAVKVLSDIIAGEPQYLARFQREAHTAASLKHPNLVGIWDYGAGARPYLVMEYVEGGDLAERIETGRVPPIEDLAHDLLEALRHMHAAGVLHRDIKPHNVLVAADGTCRLTDFGIAQPAGATALTRTGLVIGTESYIAPEVRQGEPASERSDLFALGVVLADVAGDSAPTAIRDLTEQLRDPQPDRRPASAAAALSMLERSLEQPSTAEQTMPFAATASERTTAEQPATAGRAEATAQPPPPFTPSPTGVSATTRPRRYLPALLAVAAIGAVVAVALALALGGGDGNGSGSGNGSSGSQSTTASNSGEGSSNSGEGSGNGGGGAAPVEEEPAPETETPTEEPVADVATDGAALNDEGKSLIDAGQPEEAVPVLEEAVAALEGSGDELTYNYALFNLAQALRQSGRPEEAIPLLEQRLDYPDQTEVVQAELDAARAEAGSE